MGVAGPSPASPDRQDPLSCVDVRPLESECLSLPETKGEGEGEDPPDTVAVAGGADEDPLDFLDVEGLDVVRVDSRSPGDGRGVSGEMSSADGFVECRPDGSESASPAAWISTPLSASSARREFGMV